LPRKNVLPIDGKPLVAWSIDAAKAARFVDRIVVSTDDPEIAAAARQAGAEIPAMRPPALATDDSPVELAILHMLDSLDRTYDYFVLLEPTTPLRLPEDIDGSIERCVTLGAPACIAVCPPSQSPYWMVSIDDRSKLHLLLDEKAHSARRQDLPPAFMINGGAYVADTAWYRQRRTFLTPETVGYVMPPERSFDIDGELDFLVVETLLRRRKRPS
jgi:N-acylneuraminate cytidylyltransferase